MDTVDEIRVECQDIYSELVEEYGPVVTAEEFYIRTIQGESGEAILYPNYCPKCGTLFVTHEADGSCAEDTL